MFIYIGLLSAMVLAGRPIDDGAKSIADFPAPKIAEISDSPQSSRRSAANYWC
jgi:hypothetical protein